MVLQHLVKSEWNLGRGGERDATELLSQSRKKKQIPQTVGDVARILLHSRIPACRKKMCKKMAVTMMVSSFSGVLVGKISSN